MQNLVSKWQGVDIANRHSLLSCIAEVAQMQRALEVTTVGVLGREGTGKTTLARTVAHLLHLELANMKPEADTEAARRSSDQINKGYIVRIFSGETDLKSFRDIVEGLPPINRILIFDDASFLTKIDIKQVKHDLTKIRHLETGDVKTVLIYNYHYSKGLDKYLRDTDFHFLTYVHGEDSLNIRDRFGYTPAQKTRITKYLTVWDRFSKSGVSEFTIRSMDSSMEIVRPDGSTGGHVDNSVKVTYRWSDPFRLTMFFNQYKNRMAVYPEPGWLHGFDTCAVCGMSSEEEAEEGPKIPTEDLVRFGESYFNKDGDFGRAVRHVWRERHGYDPVHRHFNAALAYVREIEKYGCSIDDIISNMDAFKPEAMHIIKKRPGIIPRKKRYAFFQKFGVDLLAQGRKVDKDMADHVRMAHEADAEVSV